MELIDSDCDNSTKEKAFVQYFEDVFKCNICLSKLVEPKMCPHCSKLFCDSCITTWLGNDVSNGKCSNCREELKDKLVVIRWKEDLNMLQEMRKTEIAKENGECNEHKASSIEMFCVTCEKCICSKCMFSQHEFHDLKTLNNAFQASMTTLQELKEVLDQRYTRIDKLIKNNAKEGSDFKRRKINYFNNLENLERIEISETLASIQNKYLHLKYVACEKARVLEENFQTDETKVLAISNTLKSLKNDFEMAIRGPKYEAIILKDSLVERLKFQLTEEIPNTTIVDDFFSDLKISFKIRNLRETLSSYDYTSSSFKDNIGNSWKCLLSKENRGFGFYVATDSVKNTVRANIVMSVVKQQGSSKFTKEFNYSFCQGHVKCGFKLFLTWHEMEKYKNETNNSIQFEVYISAKILN